MTGVLKGYDPLMNLVLDESKEWLRDPFDPYRLTGHTHSHAPHADAHSSHTLVWPQHAHCGVCYRGHPCVCRLTDKTRTLGLTVARGTAVVLVGPVEGSEEIANPFTRQQEEIS